MIPSQYPYRQPVKHRRQPVRTHRGRRMVLLVALLIAGIFGVHSLLPRHTSAAEHASKPAASVVPVSDTALTTMDGSVNSILTANPSIDVSVTVLDLNTGTSRSYGPAVAYEAASVAKLITAVAYAQQVEAGQQSWSTTLEDGNTARVDYYNMVVNSDNTAWQSLNDQLGLDSLATTAQGIGITDYDLSANSLTTTDIALLLQKLYHGQLLNHADTALLLGDMKIANEADYIPPVVPAGVTVYHKAGLLDDRVHDAAIIDNGVHPIVLVIFTNGHGTYDFPGRTTIIQDITKAALTAYDIR